MCVTAWHTHVTEVTRDRGFEVQLPKREVNIGEQTRRGTETGDHGLWSVTTALSLPIFICATA